MKIPMYQVDAFTRERFHGNPAAVCLLEEWLPDDIMQAIAEENNLSETAFAINRGEYFDLRWFTPKAEINLAGHPTLATAFVIFKYIWPESTEVRFETPSGLLTVGRQGARLVMNFPAKPGSPCPPPEPLLSGLGERPLEVLLARDHMAVYESEEQIRRLRPRMDQLVQLESLGVIVTAPGEETDFVSRFFAPKMGIPEDPVCGSAHCTLVPYWSRRLE